MKRKLTSRKTINKIVLYFFLTVTMVFFLFPFYWIVMTSIQPRGQLYAPTPVVFPALANGAPFLR